MGRGKGEARRSGPAKRRGAGRGAPRGGRGGGGSGGRAGRRRIALTAVALLIAAAFILRRTGVVPGERAPVFDPADYRDATVVEAVDARDVVGRRAVVCGRVVNAVFARATGGQPTYLNLERPHPDQPFDVVVWGRDRGRFDPPPDVAYRGHRICVAGPVTTHQGVPRIEVRTPEQIRIERDR